MRENLIRFHLAYSFLLLKNLLLDQIGIVGKINKAQDLIYSSIPAFTNNTKLQSLLLLFKRDVIIKLE